MIEICLHEDCQGCKESEEYIIDLQKENKALKETVEVFNEFYSNLKANRDELLKTINDDRRMAQKIIDVMIGRMEIGEQKGETK